MILFHLGNASLLPLVSQNLGHSKAAGGPLFMAGLVIVPQIVVTVLAPWIGYWSEIWGRKPFLLIGLGVAAARALLFAFVADPYVMMAVQLLDGLTGADHHRVDHSGDHRCHRRHRPLQPGARSDRHCLPPLRPRSSTAAIGFIASRFGDLTGFLTMAAMTCASGALLWALLPETKPARYARLSMGRNIAIGEQGARAQASSCSWRGRLIAREHRPLR